MIDGRRSSLVPAAHMLKWLAELPAVHVTPSNAALLLLFACAAIPLMASLFYASFRLVFGILYPAYASYKAVSTKNVKEYVKWMMYWIVFAFFTCAETFTDILLSFWFPFYYEIKIILVIWLLSPVTKGSSILYRKFVHPQLAKRESEIDSYILRAKQQGYNTVLKLGANGLNFARELIVQAAMNGRIGIVEQLKRSYSMSDLSSETDGGFKPNRRSATRPMSEGEMATMEEEDLADTVGNDHPTMDVYDSEGEGPTISSGYSSAHDVVNAGDGPRQEEEDKSGCSRTSGRQRTSKNSQRTRKAATQAEDSPYATLPRSSKRIKATKIIRF